MTSNPSPPSPAPGTDWSVLANASSEALAGPLADVVTPGPQRRAALGRSIGLQVIASLAEKIHPWFSPGLLDHARVDVFAVTHRERHLILHFIADHYNSNSAQSGSDWADHYFYVGEAELDGGTLRRVTFTLEREVHLTEHEEQHYDRQLLRELLRLERCARLAGSPGDRAPFDEAVSAVRAASEARAAAANARPPSSTSPARTLTARCPACGSREIARETLFDAYQLACQACGHEEIIETYPEPESDAHWYELLP